MDVPLEIRFHNLEPSQAVEALVRERAAKLERLCDRLTACRVAIEAPHKQHRKGNVYAVHIDMSVPGGEIVVSHEPHHPERFANLDVYVVLRDAFHLAERRLTDYKQRRLDS